MQVIYYFEVYISICMLGELLQPYMVTDDQKQHTQSTLHRISPSAEWEVQ